MTCAEIKLALKKTQRAPVNQQPHYGRNLGMSTYQALHSRVQHNSAYCTSPFVPLTVHLAENVELLHEATEHAVYVFVAQSQPPEVSHLGRLDHAFVHNLIHLSHAPVTPAVCEQRTHHTRTR